VGRKYILLLPRKIEKRINDIRIESTSILIKPEVKGKGEQIQGARPIHAKTTRRRRERGTTESDVTQM